DGWVQVGPQLWAENETVAQGIGVAVGTFMAIAAIPNPSTVGPPTYAQTFQDAIAYCKAIIKQCDDALNWADKHSVADMEKEHDHVSPDDAARASEQSELRRAREQIEVLLKAAKVKLAGLPDQAGDEAKELAGRIEHLEALLEQIGQAGLEDFGELGRLYDE